MYSSVGRVPKSILHNLVWYVKLRGMTGPLTFRELLWQSGVLYLIPLRSWSTILATPYFSLSLSRFGLKTAGPSGGKRSGINRQNTAKGVLAHHSIPCLETLTRTSTQATPTITGPQKGCTAPPPSMAKVFSSSTL